MNRKEREDDLEREIQSHLDLDTDEFGRRGAERTFGNVMRVKEDVREAWPWARLEQLARDTGYGWRQIRRNPGFSAVAIATLALGIGGLTAMFSAFDTILIRPLPYAEPDRLVMVWDDLDGRGTKSDPAPAELFGWRRLNTVFTGIASTQPDSRHPIRRCRSRTGPSTQSHGQPLERAGRETADRACLQR